MDVTLQYFDDCPNWRVVEQHLIALGREFDDLHVAVCVRHPVARRGRQPLTSYVQLAGAA